MHPEVIVSRFVGNVVLLDRNISRHKGNAVNFDEVFQGSERGYRSFVLLFYTALAVHESSLGP
ncbi:hypothetical protein OXB_1858 [Bacillus sp. OxB-1]|nr:hypothetical protein OXB_1858 [Bacillus sp. OxB-1]